MVWPFVRSWTVVGPSCPLPWSIMFVESVMMVIVPVSVIVNDVPCPCPCPSSMVVVGLPMSRWRELDTFLPGGGARAGGLQEKQQGLDRHRHRERGQADLAEVDIVEIAQADPVEDQKGGFRAGASSRSTPPRGQGDVAVDHHVKSVARGDCAPRGRRAIPSARARMRSVGGRTREFEGEDGLGVRRVEVRRLRNARGSRGRDRVRHRGSGRRSIEGFRNLQVAARKALAGCRDGAGLARELNGIFRGPERGGPDRRRALDHSARRNRPRLGMGADHRSEVVAEIAEVAGFGAVDVGADAPRADDAFDAAENRRAPR